MELKVSECLGLVALVFILGFIGGVIACEGVNGDFKNEAVKLGKAEYYLDKDFNRQWRWKP